MVYRLDEGTLLVVTADFFAPVVDDAYTYGAIAAANSISDVYAMGGTPLLALNLAAFPSDMPAEIGAEILRGGMEKAREATKGLAKNRGDVLIYACLLYTSPSPRD